LFIPETRREDDGPRNVFYAIGEHDAIGVSPFGVDSLAAAEGAPLARSYNLLGQLAPLILAHQGKGEMAGFVLSQEHPLTTRRLGGYELEISLDQTFSYGADGGSGLVIAVAPDEFVGAGYGFRVAFRPATPGAALADSPALADRPALADGPALAGIASVDEGVYEDGQWVPDRRLNGDETSGGSHWRFPLYDLNLHVSGMYLLSAGSGISRCRVYRYK
jgi:Domain of unknown function (DUF5597)